MIVNEKMPTEEMSNEKISTGDASNGKMSSDKIQVRFAGISSLVEIGKKISVENNTQSNNALSGQCPIVVEWFIGEAGLKLPSVKIHQELVQSINVPVRYICYDLSGWAAFRQKDKSLDEVDPNVSIINAFNHPAVKALPSRDFFLWLKDPNNPAREIVKDPELYKISESYPETGIPIKSLIDVETPVSDAGKCYSAFQYLEGLYLIGHLLQLTKMLYFVLPNDEDKYYKFTRMSKDLSLLFPNLSGTVTFMNFSYGKQSHHRPYSGNAKVVKAITLDQLGLK